MIHFKEIQPSFNLKQDSWVRQLCLSLHLPQAMDTQTAIAAELQLMYRHAGKKKLCFQYIGLSFRDPGCSNQRNRSHFCEFVIRHLAHFFPNRNLLCSICDHWYLFYYFFSVSLAYVLHLCPGFNANIVQLVFHIWKDYLTVSYYFILTESCVF